MVYVLWLLGGEGQQGWKGSRGTGKELIQLANEPAWKRKME